MQEKYDVIFAFLGLMYIELSLLDRKPQVFVCSTVYRITAQFT